MYDFPYLQIHISKPALKICIKVNFGVAESKNKFISRKGAKMQRMYLEF